ncbi:MAG TPA: putative solute-binding protein [Limnobacter sp.]|uniref:putative solute-binding protein n=2 Tax=Limnobacter sp. TaxID=2003368 RepID=UPI002E33137D|nr:putative solute-binding protein [Limnobacter sp.]HEX5485387.1 putative solute-binding protein [Limnobacter sp.]
MPKFRNALCLFIWIFAGIASTSAYSQTLQMPDISGISQQLMKEVKPLKKPLHIKICIFDILGRSGPVFSIAQDVALEARKWNVFAELIPFTNENVAAESFKTGQCEAVGITTLRARSFVPFMGSLDAVGAVPDYQQMKTAIELLMSSDSLYALSRNGKYQVVGIAPLGAAYVMVNDRSINSIEKAAGKKVAVMDWDKSQAKMIQQIGAQAVPSDITNFSNKFNNGVVDIIAAPALAFAPLELYRGLGTKGGIFDLPLINVTGTALLNRERIEKEVPDLDDRLKKMRKFGLQYLDMAFDAIRRVESQVPSRYWMHLSPEETEKYTQMMRQARMQLTADGIYDPKMMHLLKKIRCHYNPDAAECSLKGE